MPRKPNRKDTQPYVPAGNGDASGEYRGYEEGDTYSPGYKPKGSGKGKVVPKGVKPEKEENTAIDTNLPKEELSEGTTIIGINRDELGKEIGFKSDNLGNNYKKVVEHILSNCVYNQEEKDYIEKVFSLGDDDCNKLIASAQKKNNVRYNYAIDVSYCSAFATVVAYDKEAFGTDKNSSAGDTIYHENGHLIDLQDEGAINPKSYSMKDSKYNKTLHEMIGKETLNANEIYKKVNAIREEYKNKYGKEEESALADFDNQEESKKIKAEYDEIWDERAKTLQDLSKSNLPPSEKYQKQENAFKEADKKEKIHREKYKDYYDKRWDLRVAIAEAKERGENEFKQEYGSVSDMLDSRGMSLGMGHYTSYWQRRGARGMEFFAEAFAEKATGIGHLKEFFPKSYEVFENLLKEIE